MNPCLVQEVLDMVEAEVLLGVDDAVEVRFHEIRHDVDILELLCGRWDQDVHDAYDLNDGSHGHIED